MIEIGMRRATAMEVIDDDLRVQLSDGRTLSAPLAWFPRLAHATPTERATSA